MTTIMTNTAITIATPHIPTINSADALILLQGHGARGTGPDSVKTPILENLASRQNENAFLIANGSHLC